MNARDKFPHLASLGEVSPFLTAEANAALVLIDDLRRQLTDAEVDARQWQAMARQGRLAVTRYTTNQGDIFLHQFADAFDMADAEVDAP